MPAELQAATIEELPAAPERLLQDTPLGLRESVTEQLMWAVKGDDDIKSRAWIALVSLGQASILPIWQQVMEGGQNRNYRCRLVQILGEIGEKHHAAMVPLLKLLSTTKVPQILEAARAAVMRINAAQPASGGREKEFQAPQSTEE